MFDKNYLKIAVKKQEKNFDKAYDKFAKAQTKQGEALRVLHNAIIELELATDLKEALEKAQANYTKSVKRTQDALEISAREEAEYKFLKKQYQEMIEEGLV